MLSFTVKKAYGYLNTIGYLSILVSIESLIQKQDAYIFKEEKIIEKLEGKDFRVTSVEQIAKSI